MLHAPDNSAPSDNLPRHVASSTLLHVVRNSPLQDNVLLRHGLEALRQRLPPGWRVREPAELETRGADAAVEIVAPDRSSGSLAVEVKARLDPKRARDLIGALRERHPDLALLVIAPYLSEATRARLRDAGVGYLDLTGNVRIVVSQPGLFIEARGAEGDPDRDARGARSLRGPKAGRIVRALIDQKRPPGVRELGALTQIDPGYVSRVLAYLDAEALVTRVGRGRLESVDWPALLRRWAADAPLESRGRARTYLEPRGLSALTARLASSEARYAVTGSLAAAAFAPVAPARLAMIWARDAARAAVDLELRPADAGANVILLDPRDEGAFEGAARRDGVWYAAPSQIAADLLTSPGRGPSEGEELIRWMTANEEEWRR